MRAFRCDNCSRLVYFENTSCLNCGAALAFDWREREIRNDPEHRCANLALAGCNAEVGADGRLCFACLLHPHPSARRRPRGPRRLPRRGSRQAAPAVRVRASSACPSTPTARPRAASPSTCSRARPNRSRPATPPASSRSIWPSPTTSIASRVRTPARRAVPHAARPLPARGRPLLLPDPDRRARQRWSGRVSCSATRRADYQAALDRHYEKGPPADWQAQFVSDYATMHPCRGLRRDLLPLPPHPRHPADRGRASDPGRGPAPMPSCRRDLAPSSPEDFESVIAEWLPLTYALNAINRSMGKDEPLPVRARRRRRSRSSALVADLARAVRRDPGEPTRVRSRAARSRRRPPARSRSRRPPRARRTPPRRPGRAPEDDLLAETPEAGVIE